MAKKSIGQIRIDLINITESEVRKLVLEIHNELIIRTPIETGWARANWLLSTGSPVLEPVGSKENVETSTRAAGVGAVIGWNFGQGPIYDTNNVPYIRRLNEGSSTQAPEGFVEATIQAKLKKFNRKKFK